MTGDTTAAAQRYLDELANFQGEAPAEPIVRELLATAVDRLHLLCRTLLFRSYPRLARPPLSLQTEEMLDAVVERLLKAMREVRPPTVRQFFALANQHMRWELNDLARRLDKQEAAVELRESAVPAPPGRTASQVSPQTPRVLGKNEKLPEKKGGGVNLGRVSGVN